MKMLLAPILGLFAAPLAGQSMPLAAVDPHNSSQIAIMYQGVPYFRLDDDDGSAQWIALRRLRSFGSCVVASDPAGSQAYLISRVRTDSEYIAGRPLRDVFDACRVRSGASEKMLALPLMRASAVRDAMVKQLDRR